MARVKITVSYDGTDFHGFARQPELRTVQGVLEEAIWRTCGKRIEVFGASRTDAGVHARRQVIHVDLDESPGIPHEQLAYALRRQFPQDITLLSTHVVAADFHARHNALRKTYRYTVCMGQIWDVFRVRYEHRIHTFLDIDAMAEAAIPLLGTHDFTSFCYAHAQQESKIRTIEDIRVVQCDKTTVFVEVTGKAFLHNMIRILAGTLLEVGKGRLQPRDVEGILAQKDRRVAGPTAPPHGLTLWDIVYADERIRDVHEAESLP